MVETENEIPEVTTESTNALESQVIRTGEDLANPVQTFERQGCVARMGKQVRSIANILSASDTLKDCSESLKEIGKSIAHNESLKDFSKAFDNAALPDMSVFSGVEHIKGAVNETHPFSIAEPNYVVDPPNFDFRTNWHQLIILGNGFDCACGLKSKFSDFFGPRRRKLQELSRKSKENSERGAQLIANTRQCDGEEIHLTVWDIILMNDENKYWCDIEATIARFVLRVFPGCTTTNKNDFADSVNQMRSMTYLKTIEPMEGINAADCLMAINPNMDEKTFSQEALQSSLIDELHILEHEFDEYLSKEVEKGTYKQKCNELFLNLLYDDLPDQEKSIIEHSVLDFNYTDPYWGSAFPVEDLSIINIHGRLGKEIIIGIDSKDRLSDPLIAPFTKTYRLLFANQKPIKGLIRPVCGNLDDGTAVIKIYGHSLSEADYSYFQSVFDGVNLYGGTTQLIFYYRPYKPDARQSLVDSVTNLIDTYGGTLDNKDHGDNLMHKLLLEGRLSVREIE